MTHAGVLKTDGSRSESAHGSKLLAYLLLPVVWPPTPVWMSACWLINAITRRAALLSGLRAPPSPHFCFQFGSKKSAKAERTRWARKEVRISHLWRKEPDSQSATGKQSEAGGELDELLQTFLDSFVWACLLFLNFLRVDSSVHVLMLNFCHKPEIFLGNRHKNYWLKIHYYGVFMVL